MKISDSAPAVGDKVTITCTTTSANSLSWSTKAVLQIFNGTTSVHNETLELTATEYLYIFNASYSDTAEYKFTVDYQNNYPDASATGKVWI